MDTSVDESLENFKGDTQQRYVTLTPWVPRGFSGFGIATISALLQIFGILSWQMQVLRKSQNQDLRADPAWSINSGKMESNPGDFPGFSCLRTAASSSGLKGQRHCDPQGCNLPYARQLLVDQPGGLAIPCPVFPVLHELRGDGIAETGHW